MKREVQAKNNGELQSTGRSKLCTRTHADNLALGNTDPPEQQAYTTVFRPREVVGPHMEVVACPTLTLRDQTLDYTENELPASFSRASCWNHLQFSSLRLARRETKAREHRGCCCSSPACYLRGICAAGCVAVLAVGCVLCTAVLM